MTAAAADDRDLVGPYRLVKAIGAGGSARVDLARIDRAYGFQRHVVIKRPLEHLRDDPRAAASIRREARIGGLLRHPNLIGVLDAGSHDGYEYLVLEYVHGASLRALMQVPEEAGRVRDCQLAVAIAIAADVAHALDHAHELADEDGASLGLVHRDVSPGNVLIALDGAVKLADFGIAKETRVATLSGSMHGTVTYMAPEQCRGHAFDHRADVFSLGVILYELVTGSRLFWADNDVASLHRVLSGNVPRPRKVKPTVSAALEDIIMTAVAHDPDRRFATARALAEALETHAEDLGELLSARAIAAWAEASLDQHDVPWLAATTVPDAAPRTEGSLVALIYSARPEDDGEPPAAQRDVPWLAAATIPDPAPRSEGSLVALIQATPDEPASEAFGPSDELEVEPAAERRPPGERVAVRRRRRIVLGAVIAAGLVAGSAATAIVMTRAAPDQVTGRVTAPAVEAPTRVDESAAHATPPTATTPRIDDAHGSSQIAEPVQTGSRDEATPRLVESAAGSGDKTLAEPIADHAGSATRPKPRTGRPKQAVRDQAGSAASAAPVTVTQPPVTVASPPPAEPARSGSAARPPVKWDPTLLLPTDTKTRTGSGSRR